MTQLTEFMSLAAADNRLCVLSTTRPNGHIQSTVVNVGVIDHPVTGRQVAALVAETSARKVANLRSTPRATVAAKSAWDWATIEGTVEIVDARGGPIAPGADEFRRLLREVSAAAVGGAADDWTEHISNLNLDEHVVVLITPVRVYAGSP